MDLLQGIQEIPGQTSGEKFKHINLTAKDIAEKKLQDVNFPKPLEPLLNVEVAKRTNDTNIIIEALITSDSLLCQRALQIPDLFPSENSPLLNWEYFNNQLLSRVSFITRCKIIKKLETDLQSKDPKVAEEFYLNISKIYGKKHAHPLLLACSEHFILERVQKDNLVLSMRNVTKFFQKSSALVTKYLMILHDSKNKEFDNLYKFVPNLVDDHFESFLTLCVKGLRSRKPLGMRRTKVFLSKAKHRLIENPKTFLDHLCWKIVLAKLSTDEFITMLSNLLEKKMSYCNLCSLDKYLKSFPEEKKCSFKLAAFKKAYGVDLCDHSELVNQSLLCILPTELRIKVAAMKLEKDNDWHLQNLHYSWRVYLPFNRIFEDVKMQILKSSDASERLSLIELLILCCKINKDADGLLQLLKYTQVRHKNEKYNFWHDFMSQISHFIDGIQLNQEHWDILFEILHKMELNASYNFPSLYSSCLPLGIRFKLRNKLDPDEYVKYYLKLMITNQSVHIHLSDNLELDKVYLEKLMDLIVDAYLLYGEVQKYNALDYLFNSMKMYNDRAKSTSKDLPLLKIEDHPLLLEFIKPIAETDQKCISSSAATIIKEWTFPSSCVDLEYTYPNIKEYVRVYNPELYSKWYSDVKDDDVAADDDDEPPPLSLKKGMKLLKNDFSQFVSNWDKYVDIIFDSGKFRRKINFVKMLRWYQDLPIKLATHCLSLVDEPDNYISLTVLGILYESSKFEELIKKLLPQQFTVDPFDLTSAKCQKQAESYFKGMQYTNPSMPLDFFKQFFTSDYLPLCVSALGQTASRTPIPSVINFVSTSVKDRVAVTKKLIYLLSNSAPIKDQCKIYTTIMHSNKHPSIHGCIMLKVQKLFRTDPTDDVWNLLTQCIQKGIIEDQSVLEKISKVDHIPDQYLETYVKKIIPIIEQVKIDGYPELPHRLLHQVISGLNDKKYSQVLSVEFQLQLIKDHVLEEMFNKKLKLSEHFIFTVFLHDRSEQKIDILLDTLKNYVTTYYAKPSVKIDSVNFRVSKIVKFVIIELVSLTVKEQLNVTIIDRLLEFFEGMIAPYQDMKSYLFLIWAKMYITLRDPKQFGIEFSKNLDDWLRSFSSAFLHRMVEILKSFFSLVVVNETLTMKECLSKFIRGLGEVKTENCCFAIAMLLKELYSIPERKNIAEELQITAFPPIQFFLYEHMYD